MLESVFVILAAVAVGWLGHNVPAGSEPGQRTVGEVASLKASDFKAPTTSAQGERTLYAAEMSALQATLAVPLDPLTDTALPGALEAVALFNLNPNLARQHLLAAIPTLAEKSTDYQRQILTGAHTLYWMDAAPVIVQLLPKITTPKEFAIGAYTVLRAADTAPTRAQLRAQLLASFPQWEAEPRLIALERRLRAEPLQDLAARPPLRDLLGAPIRPGFPVVFSFQRKNRENPGLAMVRGADGRFVRNADGSLFHVAQLAMAKSRLPGTITNGNTPQGLFSIQGTVTATNPWIGPTPALESKVPKEASVEAFEHADASTPAVEWDESRYWSFFPASWQHYAPVREAWLAGLAGAADGTNGRPVIVDHFAANGVRIGVALQIQQWSVEYALRRYSWSETRGTCEGEGGASGLSNGRIDDIGVKYDCEGASSDFRIDGATSSNLTEQSLVLMVRQPLFDLDWLAGYALYGGGPAARVRLEWADPQEA